MMIPETVRHGLERGTWSPKVFINLPRTYVKKNHISDPSEHTDNKQTNIQHPVTLLLGL